MAHKKVRSALFLLLGLCLEGAHAQQAIPAAGETAAGSGGSVSYTVGQVFFTTRMAANGSAAEGVQQPYEISVVIGLKEAGGIDLSCSVFPNPAAGELILRVEQYDLRKLSYQLYDLRGTLLENQKLAGYETSVLLGSYVPSAYFLKVTENGKEIKVFKIIKNK